MRVCVATIVHHPEDARIMHKQIRALLDAGHEVTYVAPFSYYNVTPDAHVTAIDVRRGGGLNRARMALRRGCRDADLVLAHDIDVLRVLPLRRPPIVWDAREEPGGPLRRAAAARTRRRHHVIDPSTVPEATLVSSAPPLPGDTRVVHLGRLSAERGVAELVALAERLAPHGIRLDLIGSADPRVRPMLRDAQRVGLLDWFGYVPLRHALRMTEGALAGISLSREPGLPAKILDYMGRGVPVVSTPQELVERAACGLTVSFDTESVLHAVLDLKEDPELRAAMGARGHQAARARHHWPDQAPAFVSLLERWAGATAAAPAPAVGYGFSRS
ncbi:glycosyltransferase [Nonomuraea sp. NPDC050310]|uniref:glycosyltransferase n=1 Tax=Nonomuraea sp. NPDC050310 TaxID=3154935 RepID=UPI0033F48FA0